MVERELVELEVAGSIPVAHPKLYRYGVFEKLGLNSFISVKTYCILPARFELVSKNRNMSKTLEFESCHETEAPYPYLASLETYQSISERIKGFRRVKEAIGDIQAVTTVDPVILLQGLYYDWQQNGITSQLKQNIDHVWEILDGATNPLIVRRVFPDEHGMSLDGPRSGNINSCKNLQGEVVKFFEFYQSHYKPENVLPEIMVHRLVDASNPPYITNPFLPFASGDVIAENNHRFQIRATFGADESVQGFPVDIWGVSFEPGGHVIITQRKIARKKQSLIPAEVKYKVFDIPEKFQDTSSMRYAQIVNIAQVCKRMLDLYGPHRLEFDGTRINGFHILSIIESAPWKVRQNSPEVIARFSQDDVTMPITIMSSPDDLNNLPNKEKIAVYVDPTFFRGNEQREFITKLSTIARKQYVQLVVLASGNIGTQHAVRVLMDHGHIVMFVDEENFERNENVRIYPIKKDGIAINIDWERESPFVYMDKIQGRDIDKIGRKARGLRELQRHGYDVPSWGVIETSVFRRLLKELDPDGKISSLDNVFDSPAIQKEVTPIQQAIETYNHNFLRKINTLLDQIGGDRWAIRSSSTCEDKEGSSFAGVYKTSLNVPAERIVYAVKQVIKSALEPYAIQLANVSGINPSEVRMAVIVQKMVDAKAAGTIFTIDAAARKKDVVRIEATLGLGEGIVDGTSESHLSLQIDRSTGNILQSNIANSKKQILTSKQISQLLKIGLEVEEKIQEGPQDIEWAIDKDDKIWLLQTRPLTNIK